MDRAEAEAIYDAGRDVCVEFISILLQGRRMSWVCPRRAYAPLQSGSRRPH